MINEFKRKTFADSYLYNQEANKHDRNLVEFILKSDRIDKRSDAFKGIMEDVKRQQTSSILYTVLMMNDVVLCINNTELPRAYKVFEAKDLRLNSGKNDTKSIFIDVTGIIMFKDGYFYCKKIDILITYLFDALCYLLYQKAPLKLINNSNISISGTECFVSLFNYIIDYLRIIGYAQNKEKISYLAGLYFLYHMMGKDLDTYTKNIAAKIANVPTTSIGAFDLYYKLEDFDNIYSFINFISETFKLKDLTPEVFIGKWLYLYQTGTQYATELFTSFMVLIVNAYCGSYIVNQKQVERCCGTSMVKFATAILKLGVDEFDNRGYMEASELQSFDKRDKNTIQLSESILKRNNIPDDAKLEKEDLLSKAKVKSKINSMIKYYCSINKESSISKNVLKATATALNYISNEKSDVKVADGVLETILKESKKYINENDIRKIDKLVNKTIGIFEKDMIDYREKGEKEKASYYAKKVTELRKCKPYLN